MPDIVKRPFVLRRPLATNRPIPLSDKAMLALLRYRIQQAGSHRAFAKEAGISTATISRVLAQTYPPPRKLLSSLGLKVCYVLYSVEIPDTPYRG